MGKLGISIGLVLEFGSSIFSFPQIDPSHWIDPVPHLGFDWYCIGGVFFLAYNPLKSWCRNPKATVPTLWKHLFMGSSNFIVGAISKPGNHWLRLRRLTHGNIWKQHVPGMRKTHLWRAIVVNQNLNPSESGPHSHLHRPRRGRPTCSLAKLANHLNPSPWDTATCSNCMVCSKM